LDDSANIFAATLSKPVSKKLDCTPLDTTPSAKNIAKFSFFSLKKSYNFLVDLSIPTSGDLLRSNTGCFIQWPKKNPSRREYVHVLEIYKAHRDLKGQSNVGQRMAIGWPRQPL